MCLGIARGGAQEILDLCKNGAVYLSKVLPESALLSPAPSPIAEPKTIAEFLRLVLNVDVTASKDRAEQVCSAVGRDALEQLAKRAAEVQDWAERLSNSAVTFIKKPGWRRPSLSRAGVKARWRSKEESWKDKQSKTKSPGKEVGRADSGAPPQRTAIKRVKKPKRALLSRTIVTRSSQTSCRLTTSQKHDRLAECCGESKNLSLFPPSRSLFLFPKPLLPVHLESWGTRLSLFSPSRFWLSLFCSLIKCHVAHQELAKTEVGMGRLSGQSTL